MAVSAASVPSGHDCTDGAAVLTDPSFVGRERELTVLTGALAGPPAVLVIEGEAGWVNAMYSYQFWATPTEPVEIRALQVSAFMSLAAPEVAMRVRGTPDLALHPMTWVHHGTDFHGGFTGELFTGTRNLNLVDVGFGRPSRRAV